jgi:hypothetical protein
MRNAPDKNRENYQGKWVARRGKKIIASASTLKELREQNGVSRKDTVALILIERPNTFHVF